MSERRVVLSGTLKINSITLGALGSYENYIFQALVNNGFHVNAVRLSPSAFNVFNDLLGVTIDISVDIQFTAEQARQNTLFVIQSILSDSYIYYGSPQFSNIDLSILSDGTAATISQDQTRGGLLDANSITDEIQHLTGFSLTTLVWVVGGIFLAPYILDLVSSRKR